MLDPRIPVRTISMETQDFCNSPAPAPAPYFTSLP